MISFQSSVLAGILYCLSSSPQNVSSFTITSTTARHPTQLNLSDRGWDNGNFLDALGSGQQSIDQANAKYQQESDARAAHKNRQFQAMAHDVRFEEVFDDDNQGVGAAATPATPASLGALNEGGNRFANMMQQAQQQMPQMQQPQQQMPQPVVPPQTTTTPPSPPPPPPTPPQMPQPPQAQASPTSAMTPQDYYQALQAWQQAMVAFQQFSTANPQAAAQMTPPPPPPPPPAFNTDPAMMAQQQPQQPVPAQPVVAQQQVQVQAQQTPPPAQTQSETFNAYQSNNSNDNKSNLQQYLPKRAGGNNDAYEVNNSADVYFAQLKRDSTIRTEARKRGDLETANSPFTEEGVIALKDYLSEELIESRRERLKQNGGEFETSRDEMILPSHFEGSDDEVDKAYTGVSYKEKLMQAKNRKKNSQQS